MKTFTCPMHPEIKMNKAGLCPKCGMRLVESTPTTAEDQKSKLSDYAPLIVIVVLIGSVSFSISLRDFLTNGRFEFLNLISNFMAGFFVTFAGFKLMDLKGFANAYNTYDLLAREWYEYGYVYPFIELSFGLAMIMDIFPTQVLLAEIILMSFSGIGVLLKLLKRERFQCACLGTFLKVPLTKVTLIEDFGMALLAVILLILN